MQEIFVRNKTYKNLLEISQNMGITIEELCDDIFALYFESNNKSISLEENDEIIKFYKDIYKKKFLFPPTENFDLDLLSKTLLNLNQNLKDLDATKLALKKVIAWYINCHDSLGQDGSKIPHRLNILLKENWLFTNGLEATAGKTLDFILQNGYSNFKSISKAINRGDLNGQVHENLSAYIEELILKFENIIDKYNLDRRIKKNPKISKLFESDIPTKDYIEEAKRLIDGLELKLANE